MSCLKFMVSGHVQGVFYRDSTREQAKKLSITGYAKNLANGQVEVLACGSKEALSSLEAWLWQGPVYAEVENVIATSFELDETPTFFSTQ